MVIRIEDRSYIQKLFLTFAVVYYNNKYNNKLLISFIFLTESACEHK